MAFSVKTGRFLPTDETTSIDARRGFGSQGTGRAYDLSTGLLRRVPDHGGNCTYSLQINSSSSPSSEPAIGNR